MKRELRRLRERADQQQDARRRQRATGHASVLDRGTAQLREVDGVQLAQQQQRSREERRVAGALGEEQVHRGTGAGKVIAVVPDQQIGRDPRDLPTGEDQEQVGGEHDEQRPADEQRERREVPLRSAIGRQVVDRVQRDERRDPGDRERHREHRAVDHQ